MSKQKKNKKPDWLKNTWQMKQTLRQSKYIEDTLNDVFARNMPELHEQEEFGNPELQKRLTEIMLTRKVKPKGETK